jgi:hypothetical protein
MTETPTGVASDVADDAAIAAQFERRRRAAAEHWQLDDQVVLVGAGDRIPSPVAATARIHSAPTPSTST